MKPQKPVYLVPTLHPAFVLRDGERWSGSITRDLKLAKALQRRRPRWSESGSIEFPTVDDIVDIIAEVKASGEPLSVDIEGSGDDHPLTSEIRMIGMGYSKRAISIHLLHAGGARYWKPKAERKVLALIRGAMQDPDLGKVGHNFICHDQLVMENLGLGPINGRIEDTMVAWHVLNSEMPMSLAYITSIFTECAFYKDMGADPEAKGGKKWGNIPDEVLAIYNIRDVLTCARVWQILKEFAA